MNPKTPGEPADVCIVGLGYVGLTLATAFALVGLRVVGTDRVDQVIATISAGETPFHEDSLGSAVAEVVADGRLQVRHSAEPLPVARAYVITVGTPVHSGVVRLTDLESALSAVAAGMPDDALIVLRSTVRVGTTRSIADAVLRQSGRPYRLAMAPERTIEGRALMELRSLPQIVGGIDERSTDAAAELFSALGVEIVRVGNPEAAELAKLASNTFRDVQFAFANELAYLADSMGVDVYEVITACNYGYDRMNVGKPGPVAGPCLEKDAYILADSASRFGSSAELAMTGRRTNELLVEHVLTALGTSTPAAVSVVGLAFKGRPATSDVRGSMAEDFARAFRDVWPDVEISGSDPLVSSTDARSMGIELVDEISAVASGEVILVQTNHTRYSSPEFLALLRTHARPGSIVIDLWNQIPAIDGRDDVTLLTLGRMRASAS